MDKQVIKEMGKHGDTIDIDKILKTKRMEAHDPMTPAWLAKLKNVCKNEQHFRWIRNDAARCHHWVGIFHIVTKRFIDEKMPSYVKEYKLDKLIVERDTPMGKGVVMGDLLLGRCSKDMHKRMAAQNEYDANLPAIKQAEYEKANKLKDRGSKEGVL